MARENKIWKIDSFHGGLNQTASESDLDSSHSTKAVNVSIDDVGSIKLSGIFEPLDGVELDVDPLNVLPYSRGGYGLFSFISDYYLIREDGTIYKDDLEYAPEGVIITLIPNGLYFHIRQQVGHDVIYAENVIAMNVLGFYPVKMEWNWNALPSSLLRYTNTGDEIYLEGNWEQNNATLVKQQYAFYHADKGVRISDGNYDNNFSLMHTSRGELPEYWNADSEWLNHWFFMSTFFGEDTMGLVRKLQVYEGDYFPLNSFLPEDAFLHGEIWEPCSFSGITNRWDQAVYDHGPFSDVEGNPWRIPSRGGSPSEEFGNPFGVGISGLNMTWYNGSSIESAVRTMLGWHNTSGYYGQPGLYWQDHHNSAFFHPPTNPISFNDNGLCFVSRLPETCYTSENFELVDDIWGTNTYNSRGVSKENDVSGEVPVIDDDLKWHYAWHLADSPHNFSRETNDVGEIQNTLGSPVFRIGELAYQRDVGSDNTMEDYAQHNNGIVGFGTPLTGSATGHSIRTNANGMHSVYATIMGGTLRWWDPADPSNADAYSTKAMFGSVYPQFENGGPNNIDMGDHFMGQGLYFYTGVNKFVPQTTGGVYSGASTWSTDTAAGWDRVREYSLADGMDIGEDPGMYHLGSICKQALGQRGQDISGFLGYNNIALPPFPWYNIHLCDVDLQNAEHLSLYFLFGGQAADRKRLRNWVLDIADFRIDYTSYYPEYEFQPQPWESLYIHPITTTSTLEAYTEHYTIINQSTFWENMDIDLADPHSGNDILTYFNQFFPGNSYAVAPKFLGYYVENSNPNILNTHRLKNSSSPTFLELIYGGEDDWYQPAVSRMTCMPDTGSDVWDASQDLSNTYGMNAIQIAYTQYAAQNFKRVYIGKWGFLTNLGAMNSGSQRGYCFADVTELKFKDLVPLYKADINAGGSPEELLVNKGLEFIDDQENQEYGNDYDREPVALEQHVMQIAFSGNQTNRQFFHTQHFSDVDLTGTTQLAEDNWGNISNFMEDSFMTGKEQINTQSEVDVDPDWDNIGSATFTISSTFADADDFGVHSHGAWSNNTIFGQGVKWFYVADSQEYFPGDEYCVPWDFFDMMLIDISNMGDPREVEGTIHRLFTANADNPPVDLQSPDYTIESNDGGGEDVRINSFMGTLDDYLNDNGADALPYPGTLANTYGNDDTYNNTLGQIPNAGTNYGVYRVSRGWNSTEIRSWTDVSSYSTHLHLFYIMGSLSDIPEVKVTWNNNDRYDLVGFIPHYGTLSFSGGFFFTNTLQSNIKAQGYWTFFNSSVGNDPHHAPNLSPSIYFHLLRLCSLSNVSNPVLEGPLAWINEANQGLAYQESLYTEVNNPQGNLWPLSEDGWGMDYNYYTDVLNESVLQSQASRVHIEEIDRDSFTYPAMLKLQNDNYAFFNVEDNTDAGGPENNLQSQDWCKLPYNYTPFNANNVNAGHGYYPGGEVDVQEDVGPRLNNEEKIRAGRSWKWWSMVGVNLVFKERNRDSGATLAEDVSLTENVIDVSNGSLFAVDDYIRIGDENMIVTNVSSNELTVTRAVRQSSNIEHYNGDNIRFLARPKNIISPIIEVEKDVERIQTNLESSNVGSSLNIDVSSLEDVLAMFANNCGIDVTSPNYQETFGDPSLMNFLNVTANHMDVDPDMLLVGNSYRWSFYRYFHSVAMELFS